MIFYQSILTVLESPQALIPFFSEIHIYILLFWTLVCIFIPLIGVSFKSYSKSIAVLIFVLTIFQEIVDHWNRTFGAPLSLEADLPLHICQYTLYLSTILLFKKNQNIFEFCFYMTFSGGLQAMLTPDLNNSVNVLGVITFFSHHGIMILIIIWAIVVNKMKLRPLSYIKSMAYLNLIAIPVSAVNYFTGGNYMYLAEKPPVDNPFLIGEHPFYIIGLEAISLVYCFGLFLIMNLMGKTKRI